MTELLNSGDWSISLDAAIGKRLANPTAFANQYAIASVDVVYNVSPTLRFGVTPSVRWRYYNDYFGAPRRDFRFDTLTQMSSFSEEDTLFADLGKHEIFTPAKDHGALSVADLAGGNK